MIDQKYITGYVKRKGGAKVPETAVSILDRIKSDMRVKNDPILVKYFLNKGKSKEDITKYLCVEVLELETYSMDVHDGAEEHDDTDLNRQDATMGLMACFAGGWAGEGEVNTEEHLRFLVEVGVPIYTLNDSG